jgi:hypothetical protein
LDEKPVRHGIVPIGTSKDEFSTVIAAPYDGIANARKIPASFKVLFREIAETVFWVRRATGLDGLLKAFLLCGYRKKP